MYNSSYYSIVTYEVAQKVFSEGLFELYSIDNDPFTDPEKLDSVMLLLNSINNKESIAIKISNIHFT